MEKISCAYSVRNGLFPERVLSQLNQFKFNYSPLIFFSFLFGTEVGICFVWFGGLVKKKEKLTFAVGTMEEGCDVFRGRWVRDESNRPLYQESECPYIQPQLTCQEHGRPDKEYQYWRWQPHGCDLPRSLLFFPSVYIILRVWLSGLLCVYLIIFIFINLFIYSFINYINILTNSYI